MGSSSKHINPKLKEAFQGCQDSFSGHPTLVKKLKHYYLSTDPDKFFEDFIFYLKFPISGVTERSTYVDRTLEFVAKFACSFLEKDDQFNDVTKNIDKRTEDATSTDDDSEEELPLFMYRLFAWLLDHHEVEGSDARLRVCQLLNKMLKYMGEEACIDDDLYNKIYDGMLERLKDKVAEIRSQAVTALQRLQDPKDENCPIIKAYLFHLAHDPNNVVRRTIVRCIGATRLTLPHILERTRDTDEHVRRAAYKFLAEKVHIKSLTIGQREGVLARGLGERSEVVRGVVVKEMIPSWLRLSNNNIVQMLHHLDVGNSDHDGKLGVDSAPAGALNVLFVDTPYRDLVSSFQYLDTDKLIPYKKLTPETAIYWRVLVEFFAKQNGPGAAEYLEMILPELTPFCQYVRKYILDLASEDEDGNWEFIAKQLISMTNIYDLGDEVGRLNLFQLVKDLLSNSKTPSTFIGTLVTVFTRVEKNTQSRIEQVAEIISELNDPMVNDTNIIVSSSSEHEANSASKVPFQENQQDEEGIRAKKLEIAKVRVKMNEFRDQLDNAVSRKDFLVAQEIKGHMDQLDDEQGLLEEQMVALKNFGAIPSSSEDSSVSVDTIPAAAQLDIEDDNQVRVQDNPAVVLKCLKLLVATLQDPSITQLNSTLLTLLDEFVTVSVQSEVATVRKEAMTAIACCCLRSLDNARRHMLLLLQAAHIDVLEVRIAAIIAVVDLLMKYGLSSFITTDTNQDSLSDTSSISNQAETETNIDQALESDIVTRGATLTQSELDREGGNSVVAILSKVLDEPDLDLRTEVVEGLCKLFMIGSINSPKLLSRLLLIWYNPMTESDSKLRHILGTFFPLYSSVSKAHQVAIEAAFLPTMKVLFDAPITSPLAEVDTEDVGMFLVHLTRVDLLQNYDSTAKDTNILESSTTSVHDNLAMAICNEVLSAPDNYQTKVLVKILTSLVVTHNNFVHLKELKVLSESMLEHVKEKSCVRILEKFDKQLEHWMSKDPNKNTPGVNKRKNQEGGEQIILEKRADVTLTPTRGKRTLFSQSMLGNFLNPEFGNALRTTSEEYSLSGTAIELQDSSVNSFVEEDEGDKTLVAEDEVGDYGEDTEKSDESSLHVGDEATNFQGRVSAVPPIEVLAVSSEDDDDIFSDASSVSSINLSKLPMGAVDNSSESDDEDVFAKTPSTIGPQSKTTKQVSPETSSPESMSILSVSNVSSNRSMNSSSSTRSSSKSSQKGKNQVITSTLPTVKKVSKSTGFNPKLTVGGKARTVSSTSTNGQLSKKGCSNQNKSERKRSKVSGNSSTASSTCRSPNAKKVAVNNAVKDFSDELSENPRLTRGSRARLGK